MSETPAPGWVDAVIDDGVGRIVIRNAARRNALSPLMLRQMAEAVARFDADETIRVIAVEGEGDKAFCAGADLLGEHDEAEKAWSRSTYAGAADGPFHRLLHATTPTVAIVRGACFGGGIALASVCDMRIGVFNTLVSLPATKLGIGYAHFAMARLVALIGSGAASDMLYTSRRYDAAAALALRFLDRVEQDSDAVLREIAAAAPLSVRAAKFSIGLASGSPAARSVAEVEAAIAACGLSADLREGQAAFREKRAPRFEGR